MTLEWPHLLISCSQEKHRPQKSDNASANIPAAVLRCPSLHCAWAMQKSFSFQPDGKLDTMWRDAWQRLASSYPTSRWDVAVNLMVTATEWCSLSHRQKHRNLQLVNCSSPSQTFCPLNSPDLDTVNCHLGCNSADGLPSSRFLLSWQN